VAALEAAVAGGMFAALADIAGSTGAGWPPVGALAEVETVDSPVPSASASGGTVMGSPVANSHSAAAGEECRAHTGHSHRAAAASCSCGVDPWSFR
jgi:hypothetical protein